MSLVPSIGDPVTVRYTKWDGTRHWTFPAVYLGADNFGRWVGCPRGTVLDKPGTTIEPPMHFVVLFPTGSGHTPCFNEATPAASESAFAGVAVYVDITTVPEWVGADGDISVTMVDLDLDIIRQWDGTVRVDDEDEFLDHQVAMAYPPDVVAQAEADWQLMLASVQADVEPYATVGKGWLDRFIASLGE